VIALRRLRLAVTRQVPVTFIPYSKPVYPGAFPGTEFCVTEFGVDFDLATGARRGCQLWKLVSRSARLIDCLLELNVIIQCGLEIFQCRMQRRFQSSRGVGREVFEIKVVVRMANANMTRHKPPISASTEFKPPDCPLAFLWVQLRFDVFFQAPTRTVIADVGSCSNLSENFPISKAPRVIIQTFANPCKVFYRRRALISVLHCVSCKYLLSLNSVQLASARSLSGTSNRR